MKPTLSIEICKGATLPDPLTGRLLKEGDTAKVPNTSFWRRRLKEKSIKIAAAVKIAGNAANKNSSKTSSKNSNSQENK